eukprot:scaffold4308_cov162-Ochromonas_danica.AAC.2
MNASSNALFPPGTIEIIPVYTSFFADFGPLDIGLTYKFCKQLDEALKKADRPVLYYFGQSEHSRSNSAVLLGAYMIFVRQVSVEQAYAPFIGIQPPFVPFRDAGFCVNTFPLTVLDCMRAMDKARKLGHFQYSTFRLQEFQDLGKLQNGDVSWIIPGRFIAFAGPLANRRKLGAGLYTLSPAQYAALFQSLRVGLVVRFNDVCYDKRVFTSVGIKHVDLYYEDGANPPDNILNTFLSLCESTFMQQGSSSSGSPLAVAVHCKAGLGRTGTNIAAYMIKHYDYTAREAIAWCRLCRPGSIVGPQQQYLVFQEAMLRQQGALFRERFRLPNQLPASASKVGASVPKSALSQSSSSTLRPSSAAALAGKNGVFLTQDSTTTRPSSSAGAQADTGNKHVLPLLSAEQGVRRVPMGSVDESKEGPTAPSSLSSSGTSNSSTRYISVGRDGIPKRPHTSNGLKDANSTSRIITISSDGLTGKSSARGVSVSNSAVTGVVKDQHTPIPSLEPTVAVVGQRRASSAARTRRGSNSLLSVPLSESSNNTLARKGSRSAWEQSSLENKMNNSANATTTAAATLSTSFGGTAMVKRAPSPMLRIGQASAGRSLRR